MLWKTEEDKIKIDENLKQRLLALVFHECHLGNSDTLDVYSRFMVKGSSTRQFSSLGPGERDSVLPDLRGVGFIVGPQEAVGPIHQQRT